MFEEWEHLFADLLFIPLALTLIDDLVRLSTHTTEHNCLGHLVHIRYLALFVPVTLAFGLWQRPSLRVYESFEQVNIGTAFLFFVASFLLFFLLCRYSLFDRGDKLALDLV